MGRGSAKRVISKSLDDDESEDQAIAVVNTLPPRAPK